GAQEKRGLEADDRLDLATDRQVGHGSQEHAGDDHAFKEKSGDADDALADSQVAVEKGRQKAQDDAVHGDGVDDGPDSPGAQDEEIDQEDDDQHGIGGGLHGQRP